MSIRHIFLTLWRRRGVLIRGLVCWGIGCLVLISDEVSSYDTRLQIRGDQAAVSEIVLVTFRPSDIQKQQRDKLYADSSEVSDSAYWNDRVWSDLIKTLLSQAPRAIGVTLLFPEGLYPSPATESLKTYLDPRVTWGILSPQGNRATHAPFAQLESSQLGTLDFLGEEDGLVRRFLSPSVEIPHLAEMVTGIHLSVGSSPRFINFRGGPRSFSQYYVSDILSGKLPADALHHKIILIGAEGTTGGKSLTPVGSLSRAQIIAQVADNLIEGRWIRRATYGGYCILLLSIIVLTIFIISRYPPSIAFAVLIWLCLLIMAISVWIFDTHYFWFPLVSPIIMIAVTWIIFVGYQAHRMERKTWQLEQQQKYLIEVEQLKNNFVSLISHDLKTPIAKIQSISDRLLLRTLPADAATDLKSLRSSSEELHNYIQSILKLLRVESRDLKLSQEVCDINELIEEAVQKLQPIAIEKQQKLELNLEPLFSIEADTTLIREVLINLIENAIKYTPEKGLIQIQSKEVRDFVRIDIIDNGPGIPPAEVSQVWQKFVRGKDQDLKTKGTGLGLYLVKYFIELHGGQVDLESELKKGTRVSFTLPLENQNHSEENSNMESL